MFRLKKHETDALLTRSLRIHPDLKRSELDISTVSANEKSPHKCP